MRIFGPVSKRANEKKKRKKKEPITDAIRIYRPETKRHKHTRTLLLSCKTEQNVFARTNGTDLFLVLTFARTTKRTVSLTRGVRFSYLSFSFFFPLSLLVPNFIGERERERETMPLSALSRLEMNQKLFERSSHRTRSGVFVRAVSFFFRDKRESAIKERELFVIGRDDRFFFPRREREMGFKILSRIIAARICYLLSSSRSLFVAQTHRSI